MPTKKTAKKKQTKIPPDYVPFRKYMDGTTIFMSPSMYKKAYLVFKATPDPQWVKDVAMAGATVLTQEIAGGAAASALMGAYVVKELMDYDRRLDEQYRNDPTKQTYYATEVYNDSSRIDEVIRKIIGHSAREHTGDIRVNATSSTESIKDSQCFRLYRIFGGLLTPRWKDCQAGKSQEEITSYASLVIQGYIKRVPGHVGSDGEKREWCIFSHETHELLQCYKTKKDAEKALQRMHYYKNKKAAYVFAPTGRIIGKFPDERTAEDFLARYLFYVESLTTALHMDDPEDVVKYADRINKIFADGVTPASDDKMSVMTRLELLTEFLDAVLEWARNTGVALEIQGSIFFYNPEPEAVEVIHEYKDNFNRQPAMMLVPAFTSQEMEAYNISVETLEKKSSLPASLDLAKSLLNVATEVTLPEYSSFKIILRDTDGSPAYELTLPVIQLKDLKKEMEHAH